MADQGRNIKYGVGIGEDAAASVWLNQLDFNLKPVTQYATNTSAWGNIFKANTSTPLRSWVEGSLEHKLTNNSSGPILLGLFGSVNTTDNADSNAAVKDHTFTINDDINGQPLTFYSKDSLTTEKYRLARIGEWSMSVDLDDYVKFTANVLARKGVSTTATPAMTEDTEFVAKHFALMYATTPGGLAGATALSTIQSFTMTVNPNLEADNEAGSEEPYGFSSRGFDATFEMTCRYNDTTFKDAHANGTELAFQASVINTNVTIGAAAHPSLVIPAPRVFITDWDREGDLDAPRNQVMTGTIHYSPADLYALKAIYTNTTASYV